MRVVWNLARKEGSMAGQRKPLISAPLRPPAYGDWKKRRIERRGLAPLADSEEQ